ncbi:hypothetical protein K1Y72_05745 [Actinomadura sp. PM05-2]|uniref:Methylamine utilisation protein MauE domain-containing protein n=1 Tax=Actinomadura parmotrematis TaxID=2864039 RepID=A0ABS7FN93_9ACTN|nr:hypothetical protein [Actinomadura parmotrematis]
MDTDVLAGVGNAQVPLLAAVLLLAGAAKLVFREPVSAPVDATGRHRVIGVPSRDGGRVLPWRRSRRAGVALALAEGALAAALLATPALAARVAVTAVFCASVWVVGELRVRHPGSGCGCLGSLSDEGVGRRGVARAVLLAGAALLALAAPDAGLRVLAGGPLPLALAALELAVLAALSPEITALRRRRRKVMPCERRPSPLAETLETLHASAAWRRHAPAVGAAAPLDVWREGCWRFLLFPARDGGAPADLVFAVSTAERDRTVRAALIRPEPEIPARTLAARQMK